MGTREQGHLQKDGNLRLDGANTHRNTATGAGEPRLVLLHPEPLGAETRVTGVQTGTYLQAASEPSRQGRDHGPWVRASAGPEVTLLAGHHQAVSGGGEPQGLRGLPSGDEPAFT